MRIPVEKIDNEAKIFKRVSDGAAGFDFIALRVISSGSSGKIADLPVTIEPGKSMIIGSGLQVAIPFGYEIQIRPRAGIAFFHGIQIVNSPGTIDSDYRGEVGAIIKNTSNKPFEIEKGMRIAQVMCKRVETPIFEEVKELPDTPRSKGGFGHTGFYGDGLGTDEYESQILVQDRYRMNIVLAVAKGSTCVRGAHRNKDGKWVGGNRQFGCGAWSPEGVPISFGCNAPLPDEPQCSEVGCLREQENIPSGTQIERCRARHAEWWFLANMAKGPSPGTVGATMYLNAEPCEVCAKIISGLGLKALVLLKGIYPTNGTKIVRNSGVEIRYVDMEEGD